MSLVPILPICLVTTQWLEMTVTNETPISVEKHLVGLAKMRVARWFDLAEHPAKLRPKVLRGVDAIARELPKRADWFEVMTVGLDDGETLPIQLSTKHYRAFPCSSCLAVSTVVPAWGFGCHKVFKNEDVYEILSWFLHYARQYIHRSHVASVLMVAWEKHGKVLHPFGSQAISQRYGPIVPMVSPEHALDVAKVQALDAWGHDNRVAREGPTVSSWTNRNTLDPFLHQGVFHFLRAQNLRLSAFAIEAITAFDCVLQSIGAFIRARWHLAAEPTRGQTCEHLKLSSESAELAEYAYFLRNSFGAHAGGSRWWDQHELLDDEVLADVAKLAGSVLSTAADLEPQARSVEPLPQQWGCWLFENFEMVWDAVWFERLAEWQSKRMRAEGATSADEHASQL